VLNKQNLTIEQSPVSADALGGLIDLLADNTISGRIAKDVFAEMVETGKSAKDIVAAKGLQQITDTGPIEAAADQIIASSPDNVAKYKGGNEKLIGWFVGQVMKATGGKANPGVVNEILKKKLSA
jgi:aspartyl-tRNA(Asn)/glutamyl-tRNA(Gln) amidotransferase subunit B